VPDLVLLGLSLLAPAVAFVILVTRVLHPFHRWLAFGVYSLGWVPFGLAVGRHRELVQEQAHIAERALSEHWSLLAVVGALLLVGYVGHWILPTRRSVLGAVDDEELEAMLAEDLPLLRRVLARMDAALEELRGSGLLTDGAPTADQRVRLRALWRGFVEAGFACDVLAQRYRSFPEVSWRERRGQHARCFLIAWGSLVAWYRAGLLLTEAVGRSPTLRTVLDEQGLAVPAGAYTAVQKRTLQPRTLVRLNAGRAWLEVVDDALEEQRGVVRQLRAWLGDVDRLVRRRPRLFLRNPLDYLERRAFRSWLPLQKAVALQLSQLRATSRPYFIPPQTAGACAPRLEPGDVLLQRREWHLTNLGIPGYWTHLALYVGTPERLDTFFGGLEATADRPASELLREAGAGDLGRPDEDGHPLAVIEALRPGVILNSLERSCSADAVTALRPRLGRRERLEGLLRAARHLGKPYDFSFDFAVDEALVCSSLVWRAHRGLPILQPEEGGGRLLLPPNLVAERYDRLLSMGEDPGLDFVLFLDGLEPGRVHDTDEAAFRTSWRRPKWHVVTRPSV